MSADQAQTLLNLCLRAFLAIDEKDFSMLHDDLLNVLVEHKRLPAPEPR